MPLILTSGYGSSSSSESNLGRLTLETYEIPLLKGWLGASLVEGTRSVNEAFDGSERAFATSEVLTEISTIRCNSHVELYLMVLPLRIGA